MYFFSFLSLHYLFRFNYIYNFGFFHCIKLLQNTLFKIMSPQKSEITFDQSVTVMFSMKQKAKQMQFNSVGAIQYNVTQYRNFQNVINLG